MVQFNKDVPELDLLGNDLFLIVETHEELINSLIGHYSSLIDYERKKQGGGDLNKIQEYRNVFREMGSLKLELAMKLNDIEFQKNTIAKLKIRLNEVKILKSI